ncbi:MAG TPA: Gfo/Idh/MocA family oxidoreductase [Usitatibacter sp.]|nr:Gfo/Idh/MocA family oxidoreductase [Usitatibacter sp.]
MFAIVGSGFGLYGYLPAVAQGSDEGVLLPEAYREKVRARRELDPWLGRIRWVADERAALAAASTVIVATPPARQVETVRAALAQPGVLRLVLEKPVAPDPLEADRLLDEIERSGRRYRVGYTFLQTEWGARLAWPRGVGTVDITWTFMAHHFAHGRRNWKRTHATGGGAMRFFGIHFFGLLARAGYESVRSSRLEEGDPGEPERWEAVFAGAGLPQCRLRVDSRNPRSVFRIEGVEPIVDLEYPYSVEPAAAEQDRRVGVLRRFLASFDEPDAEHAALCRRANVLWREAEAAAAR